MKLTCNILNIRRFSRSKQKRKTSLKDIAAGLQLISRTFIDLPEEISSTQLRRRKIGLPSDSPNDFLCRRRRKFGSNMEENGCDTILWTLFEAVHYQMPNALRDGKV